MNRVPPSGYLQYFVRERTKHFRHALTLWDQWEKLTSRAFE